MLKNQNMIPEVYYKKSRDFQLFGRIYDFIFNYLKNNTLTIDDLNTNTNPNQNVLELICQTLGFKVKHDYNNDELSALCSIFLTCMKNKGNQKSLYLLLRMICNIQGSETEPSIEYDVDDGNGNVIDVVLSLPSNITDFSLIRDVLDYILPSGAIYILTSQSKFEYDNLEDEFTTNDNILNDQTKTLLWNPTASGIIKVDFTKNGERGKLINNNIKINENKAVDSLDLKNGNDITSVYSQILTFNYENNDKETEVKNISKNIVKSTTKIPNSGEEEGK